MTHSIRIPTVALAAALALGSTAGAAEAPEVSKQQTSSARTAPATIPGTGVQKGERLAKGQKLVFRTVTLEGDQEARTTLKAPKGKKLVGLVPVGDVGFVVTGNRSYVGRTSVSVRAFLGSADEGEVTGRIYALVK